MKKLFPAALAAVLAAALCACAPAGGPSGPASAPVSMNTGAESARSGSSSPASTLPPVSGAGEAPQPLEHGRFEAGPEINLYPVISSFDAMFEPGMTYIDKDGEIAIFRMFFIAEGFHEYFAAVKDEPGDGWYYINTNGERQGTQEYEAAGPFTAH